VIPRAPDPARIVAGLLIAWGALAHVPAAAAPILVDDFEDVSRWSAHPADGVEMTLSADGPPGARALRIDFRFARGGGYAVARRAVSLDLPERYAFGFRVRGECSPNDLEFKLIDSTGANVWWCNRRAFEFPKAWRTLTTKRRQIQFAWGPSGGGDLRRVAAIEIAITAGTGGEGTVWLDDLELREQPPPQDLAPVARASSSRPGHAPGLAIDADSASSWWSRAGERHPSLTVDFGADRELGGLVVDWVPNRHPERYAVEASEDGREWQTLREVTGNQQRDRLYLPDTETRLLRLRALESRGGQGCAVAGLAVKPLEWAASLETFFQAVARDAPRGDYPRGIAGEQPYWTVVGVDGDREEGLVSEDGAVEAGKRGFSVEPFLFADGRLWTWADARVTRWLEDRAMPLPAVRWEADSLELTVEVAAMGSGRDTSVLYCEYHVRNLASRPKNPTLYLAIRPFQVNPPAQFLNAPGGVSPIHEIAREGLRVNVNGDRGVYSFQQPSGFGASTFDQGNIVEALRRGTLPDRDSVKDTFGFASGALAYRLELPAGAGSHITTLASLGPGSIERSLPGPFVLSERHLRLRGISPVEIDLPSSAAAVTQTLYAQLGFILVNRDGPAIQPGSRSYERSWIRDGSLTGSALLRMGHPEEVREFIEWFARHQYENGKVPCCVDARGADPVPEHDSHGEFIYLVAEYFRQTGDRDLAERMWPHVLAAATYLDSLRQQRRTAEYRAPERREFYGLLPPSISHEGYSAKPMHSYWDDLFALRGFEDAGYLAWTLGHREAGAHWTRVRAEFGRDLHASIVAAMTRHRVDYVPGCADLGDFDATSTTIALSPVQAGDVVPAGALRHTFERYWAFFRDRRDGKASWEALTPYEIRNIGAFVRLGWRERAGELLDFFLSCRRPPGWPQWAEVVWRDDRAPHFIGDMPHTWVGSDYVRSVLDMFAYEREPDEALVVGAGVRESWVREAPGLSVRHLRTRYGQLDLEMRGGGAGIEVRLGGDLRVPRGGIVVAAPGVTGRWSATVNGARAPVSNGGQVVVRALPATIALSP
jgi:hypothetical protein